MWASIYITICVYVLTEYSVNVSTSPWASPSHAKSGEVNGAEIYDDVVKPLASPSQELLDEINDAEIYRAVLNSMNEWMRKKDKKKTVSRIKRQDTAVCYAELGCFEASGPFGYLDMLPNTPEEISTKFLLYPVRSNRRRSGAEPVEVPFNNISDAFTWSKKGFNSSLSTKVMIHGFGSDCSHVWVYEMRSALMTVEDVNVICVDWGNGATLPNYVKASANTRLVGKQLAIFLKGLVDNIGLQLRKMHLIGFSLGAHVAGFAGAELGNLSRITGLDPAGPLFESQDPRARLDQSDAAFVDVIHSNGENLILGGLGSWQPMGHVDFYPNGGRMQKGCTNLFLGAVTDIIWSTAVEGRSLCNHRRAYKFFTDSIHPRCHFPAFPCQSYEDYLAGMCFPCNEERKCGNMGYYADRAKGTGQLFLITRDEEPFCAHQYLIKIESSPAEYPIISYGRIQVSLVGDTLLNETFTLTKKEDEEMKLGDSISKIIVPHPILLPPSNIQILYTSYSGWLTSGLRQWKIDKISLSDSHGKSVSVCKKNLILDSGVPVVLPLFPGDCNLPASAEEEDNAEDRRDESDNSKFLPNIKEDINGSSSSIDIVNIPWTNEKENAVDGERESSRAFSTRVIKVVPPGINNTEDDTEITREVVEPILKPQSTKNGRSHDPNKERPEITEPILGPTTSRHVATKKPITGVNLISSLTGAGNKEVNYGFYDVGKEDAWIPSANSNRNEKAEKWKREEDSKPVPVTHRPQGNIVENGLEAIVKTVQFLPQRIARMFEDAEKYARETILPFVSTYTPRFISDFINPRERPKSKYVPLNYEETTTKKPASIKTTTKRTTTTATQKTTTIKDKDEASNRISSNEVTTSAFVKENNEGVNAELKPAFNSKDTGSSHTHIQKIKRKSEDVALVFPETADKFWSELEKNMKSDGRSVRESKGEFENSNKSTQKSTGSEDSSKRSKRKEIYIDLPVFEEDYQSIKYIPLIHDRSR